MIDEEVLLTWGATYKALSSNDVLFYEGADCNYYYQIKEGRLRWVNIDNEGKEHLQNLVEAGDCIGELPLFDSEPYAASAISEGKSIVIRLPKNTFHQLLKANPDIHFKFSKLLTSRLRFKFFMFKEMSSHQPEKIVMSLLNYFRLKNLHICPTTQQVTLTRQQIANYTGLRVETVIRAIRHLSEKGQLAIDKGKVYLKIVIPVIMTL